MKDKHTPGPWLLRAQAVARHGFYIETSNRSEKDSFIAEVGGGLQSAEEIKANAKLIAEAPEMYEFIKRWISMQTIAGPEGNYPEGSYGWKAQQILKRING